MTAGAVWATILRRALKGEESCKTLKCRYGLAKAEKLEDLGFDTTLQGREREGLMVNQILDRMHIEYSCGRGKMSPQRIKRISQRRHPLKPHMDTNCTWHTSFNRAPPPVIKRANFPNPKGIGHFSMITLHMLPQFIQSHQVFSLVLL